MLCYRGINIDELAENATFEEVIHLLWHGSLPKREELQALRQAIAEQGDAAAGVGRVDEGVSAADQADGGVADGDVGPGDV